MCLIVVQAMVSIAIYAHIEGEMDDKQIHNFLDMAMNICRRIPALNRYRYVTRIAASHPVLTLGIHQ